MWKYVVLLSYDGAMLWYYDAMVLNHGLLFSYDGVILVHDGVILVYGSDKIQWYYGDIEILCEGHLQKISTTRYPAYPKISYSVSCTGYMVGCEVSSRMVNSKNTSINQYFCSIL